MAVARRYYYRVASPTQTPEDARLQRESAQIWGKPARGSQIPKVKAYVGRLPEGTAGVEFQTVVLPDAHCPPAQAYWSGPRDGVEVHDGCARIRVTITKVTQ
jgi:hypothetical protein